MHVYIYIYIYIYVHILREGEIDRQIDIDWKFDFDYQETNLLDITKVKTSIGKLLTTLEEKEINRKSYLHQKSEQPETLKQSISYSQALRLKGMCTTDEGFTEQSTLLTKRLVQKGYNENEIQEQISNTFMIERAHLLILK